MTETTLVRDIQLHLGSFRDVRLFRNNVGRLQTQDGRWVQFGLCVGSSDLIGWQSIEITPEMVGQRIAVFVALEAKSKRGSEAQAQENFLRAVNDAGGRAGFVRSEEDARQLLNGADIPATLPP